MSPGLFSYLIFLLAACLHLVWGRNKEINVSIGKVLVKNMSLVKSGMMAHACNLSVVKVEERGPWSLLVSQSHLIGEPRVSSQNTWVEKDWG